MTEDRQEDGLDQRGVTNTWPVVSGRQVGVADYRYEMCRAAPYVLLNVFLVNRSDFLVKAAEFVVESLSVDQQVRDTARTWVGPLLPGVPVPVETSVRCEGHAGGVRFCDGRVETLALTPPDEMTPAAEYAELSAAIVAVRNQTTQPLTQLSIGDFHNLDATVSEVVIRLENRGRRTVDRARVSLRYWESPPAESSPGGGSRAPFPLAEWQIDAQQKGWSPYERGRDPASLESRPADPIPPGGSHEFSLLHWGVVEDWPASAATTTVDVVAVKLAQCLSR